MLYLCKFTADFLYWCNLLTALMWLGKGLSHIAEGDSSQEGTACCNQAGNQASETAFLSHLWKSMDPYLYLFSFPRSVSLKKAVWVSQAGDFSSSGDCPSSLWVSSDVHKALLTRELLPQQACPGSLRAHGGIPWWTQSCSNWHHSTTCLANAVSTL